MNREFVTLELVKHFYGIYSYDKTDAEIQAIIESVLDRFFKHL